VLDLAAEGEGTLAAAAQILRDGGLVAFPTETVYGLGALGLDPAAVERIFVAKGRPHADPLILHVSDVDAVRPLVTDLPPVAEQLAARFWPGPLTLVLPRSACVPDLVTAGQDSVAVRVPAHPAALALLRCVGAPLAAPSANLFSRPSPTTARHVLEDLDGRIDAVLDGGPTTVGVESTVLDLRGERPLILRPGGVSREELEAVLGFAVAVRTGVRPEGPLASPGLLTKHYSPRARVRLFDGPAALTAVRRAAEDSSSAPPVVILALEEDRSALDGVGVPVICLGGDGDLAAVARSLYAAFRRLDEQGVRTILTRTVAPAGLGAAINDRLRRAAGGEVERG